jgi:hypothetical protein
VLLLAMLATGCGEKSDGAPADPSGGDAAEFESCPAAVPPFEIGMTVTGAASRIAASIHAAAPSPPQKYENTWTVAFATAHGEQLPDVDVTAIQTFMPVHGHDGRPPAMVEKLAQPGQFLAKLNFSMRGYWEVRVHASSPSVGDDDLVFELCLRE